MFSRITKLLMYIRAPRRTFMLFHPVKALKLFFAFLVGKMLFGRRKVSAGSSRAVEHGPISGTGRTGTPATGRRGGSPEVGGAATGETASPRPPGAASPAYGEPEAGEAAPAEPGGPEAEGGEPDEEAPPARPPTDR